MNPSAFEIVLTILAVLVVGGGVFALRNRSSKVSSIPGDNDRHEMDLEMGFGVPCPHCHSLATEQRDGSFEKRQCVSCGHRFELR